MFTNEDFKDLFFPIHGVSDISKLDKVKQLKISDSEFDEKTLRYLIYMYDKDSPLAKKEENIIERKKKAARLAGFKISSKSDKALFIELSKLSNYKHKAILFKILQVQNNRLWTKIVTQEMFFHECAQGLINEVSMEDDKKTLESLEKKGKLSAEMDAIDTRLNSYWKEFTKGEEEVDQAIQTSSYSPESRMLRNVDE